MVSNFNKIQNERQTRQQTLLKDQQLWIGSIQASGNVRNSTSVVSSQHKMPKKNLIFHITPRTFRIYILFKPLETNIPPHPALPTRCRQAADEKHVEHTEQGHEAEDCGHLEPPGPERPSNGKGKGRKGINRSTNLVTRRLRPNCLMQSMRFLRGFVPKKCFRPC